LQESVAAFSPLFASIRSHDIRPVMRGASLPTGAGQFLQRSVIDFQSPAFSEALFPGNRFAQLGDSRTFWGHPSGPRISNSNGWQYWAEFLSRGAVRFPASMNFGVSSDTTTQMLERLPAAIASDCVGVTIFGGINDRGCGQDIDTTLSSLSIAIDEVIKAGKLAVLIAEWPSGDA
jgi:hypothetical protein